MAGGKVVYVPLKPPAKGATETVSSSEWLLDFEALEAAITNKTKMIVCLLFIEHLFNFLWAVFICRLLTCDIGYKYTVS